MDKLFVRVLPVTCLSRLHHTSPVSPCITSVNILAAEMQEQNLLLTQHYAHALASFAAAAAAQEEPPPQLSAPPPQLSAPPPTQTAHDRMMAVVNEAISDNVYSAMAAGLVYGYLEEDSASFNSLARQTVEYPDKRGIMRKVKERMKPLEEEQKAIVEERVRHWIW